MKVHDFRCLAFAGSPPRALTGRIRASASPRGLVLAVVAAALAHTRARPFPRDHGFFASGLERVRGGADGQAAVVRHRPPSRPRDPETRGAAPPRGARAPLCRPWLAVDAVPGARAPRARRTCPRFAGEHQRLASARGSRRVWRDGGLARGHAPRGTACSLARRSSRARTRRRHACPWIVPWFPASLRPMAARRAISFPARYSATFIPRAAAKQRSNMRSRSPKAAVASRADSEETPRPRPRPRPRQKKGRRRACAHSRW